MNSACSRVAVALWLACVACSAPEKNPDVLSAKQSSDIDRLIRQVPFKTGADRMSTLRQLSAFGPYAITQVSQQMLGSADDSVRANGVFVLGLIFEQDRDPRALELIKNSTADSDPRVRLEAARILLEGGDRVGVPDLIAALDDKSVFVRKIAFDALRKSVKSTLGYQPEGDEASRRAAIERFRDYFAKVESNNQG